MAMKTLSFLLLLCIPVIGYSQVLPEEEFHMLVHSAQENCEGAYESVVRSINEEFASSIWGKQVRFNQADIIRFFKHSSGEKVSAGVDLTGSNKKSWAYEYDQKTTADLMTGKGIKVTTSYNTLWISPNQVLLHGEYNEEGRKTILELYCPTQSVFEMLRTGKTQSIEFLITGYRGSVSANSTIYGILTHVHSEKQVVECSNGHEFDKGLGYNFCPTCGEPLK